MRIIAIDQGSKKCGFAILDDRLVIDSGVIKLKGIDRMARYKMLIDDLTELVCDNHLEAMAIEDIFSKRSGFNNPKTTKIMGETRGIIASVGLLYNLAILDVNPNSITSYLGINIRVDNKKEVTRVFAANHIGVNSDAMAEDQADAIVLGLIAEGMLGG